MRVIAHLTRLGFHRGTPEAIDEAKKTFAAQCCVHLKNFLDGDLLEYLLRGVRSAAFARRVHQDVEVGEPPVDVVMSDAAALGRVLFLLNDPGLFRFVETLTGCAPVGCFMPTIFKMMASDGHFDTWHSDVDGNRMVALSVNLTEQAFEGGVLQIREAEGEKRMLCEIANTGLGDAMLFLVSPRLLHKVTDVTGNVPRTVLAGWFQREPQHGALFPRIPHTAA